MHQSPSHIRHHLCAPARARPPSHRHPRFSSLSLSPSHIHPHTLDTRSSLALPTTRATSTPWKTAAAADTAARARYVRSTRPTLTARTPSTRSAQREVARQLRECLSRSRSWLQNQRGRAAHLARRPARPEEGDVARLPGEQWSRDCSHPQRTCIRAGAAPAIRRLSCPRPSTICRQLHR